MTIKTFNSIDIIQNFCKWNKTAVPPHAVVGGYWREHSSNWQKTWPIRTAVAWLLPRPPLRRPPRSKRRRMDAPFFFYRFGRFQNFRFFLCFVNVFKWFWIFRFHFGISCALGVTVDRQTKRKNNRTTERRRQGRHRRRHLNPILLYLEVFGYI